MARPLPASSSMPPDFQQQMRRLIPRMDEQGFAFIQAQEMRELLDEVGASLDLPTFLAGDTSPLFVGSALTNFGVRHLLDAIIELAPAPGPRGPTPRPAARPP